MRAASNLGMQPPALRAAAEEHFGKPIASYPPRAVLWDYIKGRVDKAKVRDWVRFSTPVRMVTFDEATERWIFDFGHEAMLTVASPWRIVVGGRIRLGWRDHGQPFGLPSPVNGVSEATKFLGGAEVKSASAAAETSDLVISFGSGCRLEVFNGSSGYESWTLNAPGGELFVAKGGGALVRFKR